MKNLTDMTTAEMVTEYNTLTGDSVKRFSNRAAGERRLTKARAEHAPTDGLAEINEFDDRFLTEYGFVHCPACDVHLENGVLDFDSLVDTHGRAEALKLQKKEYSCMGCDHEFGDDIKGVSASRSAGIAKSWLDETTALKRKARHGVSVEGHGAFRSVKQAFEKLHLPLNKHIRFRMELKREGSAVFTKGTTAFEFTLVK